MLHCDISGILEANFSLPFWKTPTKETTVSKILSRQNKFLYIPEIIGSLCISDADECGVIQDSMKVFFNLNIVYNVN
jgi:hypothetical protein